MSMRVAGSVAVSPEAKLEGSALGCVSPYPDASRPAPLPPTLVPNLGGSRCTGVGSGPFPGHIEFGNPVAVDNGALFIVPAQGLPVFPPPATAPLHEHADVRAAAAIAAAAISMGHGNLDLQERICAALAALPPHGAPPSLASMPAWSLPPRSHGGGSGGGGGGGGFHVENEWAELGLGLAMKAIGWDSKPSRKVLDRGSLRREPSHPNPHPQPHHPHQPHLQGPPPPQPLQPLRPTLGLVSAAEAVAEALAEANAVSEAAARISQGLANNNHNNNIINTNSSSSPLASPAATGASDKPRSVAGAPASATASSSSSSSSDRSGRGKGIAEKVAPKKSTAHVPKAPVRGGSASRAGGAGTPPRPTLRKLSSAPSSLQKAHESPAPLSTAVPSATPTATWGVGKGDVAEGLNRAEPRPSDVDVKVEAKGGVTADAKVETAKADDRSAAKRTFGGVMVRSVEIPRGLSFRADKPPAAAAGTVTTTGGAAMAPDGRNTTGGVTAGSSGSQKKPLGAAGAVGGVPFSSHSALSGAKLHMACGSTRPRPKPGGMMRRRQPTDAGVPTALSRSKGGPSKQKARPGAPPTRPSFAKPPAVTSRPQPPVAANVAAAACPSLSAGDVPTQGASAGDVCAQVASQKEGARGSVSSGVVSIGVPETTGGAVHLFLRTVQGLVGREKTGPGSGSTPEGIASLVGVGGEVGSGAGGRRAGAGNGGKEEVRMTEEPAGGRPHVGPARRVRGAYAAAAGAGDDDAIVDILGDDDDGSGDRCDVSGGHVREEPGGGRDPPGDETGSKDAAGVRGAPGEGDQGVGSDSRGEPGCAGGDERAAAPPRSGGDEGGVLGDGEAAQERKEGEEQERGKEEGRVEEGEEGQHCRGMSGEEQRHAYLQEQEADAPPDGLSYCRRQLAKWLRMCAEKEARLRLECPVVGQGDAVAGDGTKMTGNGRAGDWVHQQNKEPVLGTSQAGPAVPPAHRPPPAKVDPFVLWLERLKQPPPLSWQGRRLGFVGNTAVRQKKKGGVARGAEEGGGLGAGEVRDVMAASGAWGEVVQGAQGSGADVIAAHASDVDGEYMGGVVAGKVCKQASAPSVDASGARDMPTGEAPLSKDKAWVAGGLASHGPNKQCPPASRKGHRGERAGARGAADAAATPEQGAEGATLAAHEGANLDDDGEQGEGERGPGGGKGQPWGRPGLARLPRGQWLGPRER
eukprot:jgi/Mesvir1/19712/Mv09972-RA.1